MPITQERMLALIKVGKELAIEAETVRQTVAKYAASDRSNLLLQSLVMDLQMIPRPDKTVIGIEEYHFRKFYSKNKGSAGRMARKRRSDGVEPRRVMEQPLFDPVAPRLSPERLAELAAINQQGEDEAMMDFDPEIANETRAQFLDRLMKEGMSAKDAEEQVVGYEKSTGQKLD